MEHRIVLNPLAARGANTASPYDVTAAHGAGPAEPAGRGNGWEHRCTTGTALGVA